MRSVQVLSCTFTLSLGILWLLASLSGQSISTQQNNTGYKTGQRELFTIIFTVRVTRYLEEQTLPSDCCRYPK